MNDNWKQDFVDPLRNVKKSDKAHGKAFLDNFKYHLQLLNQKKSTYVAPPDDEQLYWQLKLFKQKMKRDTSKMNELQKLIYKSNNEGLTIDEKCRLNAIKLQNQIPKEPKCTCHSKGEDCKLHVIWGMNAYVSD